MILNSIRFHSFNYGTSFNSAYQSGNESLHSNFEECWVYTYVYYLWDWEDAGINCRKSAILNVNNSSVVCTCK